MSIVKPGSTEKVLPGFFVEQRRQRVAAASPQVVAAFGVRLCRRVAKRKGLTMDRPAGRSGSYI